MEVTGESEKSRSKSVRRRNIQPPEKAKKKRLFVLAGLAISFALPIYAQEQSAVDPEIRQEIEAVGMQFVEAYNRHDPAAVAALYTQDAVCLKDWEGGGLLVGREALEKGFAAGFAVSFPPVVGKLDQM